MKNIFLLGTFLFCILPIQSQNYYLATPQGFGASATGGGNATPVTVTTYTAFKNALTSTAAANAVILVSGTIDCVYTSVLLNNKTIIGLPGARLRNLQITVGNSVTSASNSGILYVKPGSNNVIIRNLIFEGPGAYDVDGRDNLTNEGTNVWVDHCEFQDGMDGNFDNKGFADNVTVSWCKFTYLKPAIPGGSGGSNDHRFTNLVGSSATDVPTDGHYSITFQNCFWASGCKARMPRARNAELHLLGCYYDTGVAGSIAIGLGGGINNTTCYVENSNFANVTSVYTSYISTDGGTVATSYNNCLNGTSNIGTVSPPTYTTTPIPVNDVKNYLTDTTCGAGASLKVTSAGIISPNDCAFLGINESVLKNFDFYYSSSNKTLHINIVDGTFGKIDIEVYSVLGQKVLSNSDKIEIPNHSLEINVDKIPNGIYICKLNYSDKKQIIKFVKE